MPSKDHAVLQQQQQQDITSTNKTSSTSVTRPKMDAKARCSAAEHEKLRKDFKAMEIVVEDGGGTLDELSFKVAALSWTVQQEVVEGNAEATRHLSRIEHAIQTAIQIKARAFKTSSTFAEASPTPSWVKAALYFIRPIVEAYEAQGEEHLGPYQSYALERARVAIDLVADMWASDMQRQEEENEGEEKEDGEEDADEEGTEEGGEADENGGADEE